MLTPPRALCSIVLPRQSCAVYHPPIYQVKTRKQVSEKREAPIRLVFTFKDQKLANAVGKQLGNLSRKVNADISPGYAS